MEVYSWRLIFLLNLPLVLVILLLAPRIPESRAAGRRPSASRWIVWGQRWRR